jgi:hypothetical protein
MRIAVFDDYRLGVITPREEVVDITDLVERYEPLGPEDLLPDLITHFDELRPQIEERVAQGNGKRLRDVRLRSPLTRPSKIVCLMGNYREGTDRFLQVAGGHFRPRRYGRAASAPGRHFPS